MKNISAQKLGILALLLFFYCATISAQKQADVVIVKKIAVNDGEIAKEARPMLGIYTDEIGDAKGIKISSVIAGKGAELAGLQGGDVITLVNGQPVVVTTDLHAVLTRQKPGDKVNVHFLRDGKDNVAVVELSGGNKMYHADWKEENEPRDPCRVFIGVGTSSVTGGLNVDYTVDNTPATTYGIKAGDVILTLDGVPVTTQSELVYERNKHKAGDPFTLVILRDGREMKIDARFKECSEEEQMMSRLKVLAPRYENFTYSVNRNPCAVFIGIYTTDRAMSGEGLRITGVIEDTPAKESGLQPGDVILSLDGQPINTYSELLVERNKHQPGDPFQLNILRDGEYLQIDATFKSCEKKQDVLVPVKEKVELIKEETPSAQREDPARPSDATLQLETFDAYPNPTFGPLNVLFEAEALPTTVRIMDVTGKAVYSNTLNQFSGYFSEQIDLFGNPPGTYILTVQQDNRLISKKITLLPRA